MGATAAPGFGLDCLSGLVGCVTCTGPAFDGVGGAAAIGRSVDADAAAGGALDAVADGDEAGADPAGAADGRRSPTKKTVADTDRATSKTAPATMIGARVAELRVDADAPKPTDIAVQATVAAATTVVTVAEIRPNQPGRELNACVTVTGSELQDRIWPPAGSAWS